MQQRCCQLRFGCDFALSVVLGSEAPALRASLPIGQQYFGYVCRFYARCNMKYNFRHKRDTSPHDNHCDLDDRCYFYFITHCNAGRLTFIISAYKSQGLRPLRNRGRARGFQLWHTAMNGFPHPVLPPCLPPLQLAPVRCIRSACATERRARFG